MVGLLIIILLNILGSYVFHRFDLTEEKRYSISDPTRKMLKELKNDVYFQIYLEGDFPGGYKRLRDEFKLMLDQFRAYAGDKIQYSFINPTADPDPVKQRELFTQLIKGIRSGCGANVLLGTIKISPMNEFFCYYKYN